MIITLSMRRINVAQRELRSGLDCQKRQTFQESKPSELLYVQQCSTDCGKPQAITHSAIALYETTYKPGLPEAHCPRIRLCCNAKFSIGNLSTIEVVHSAACLLRTLDRYLYRNKVCICLLNKHRLLVKLTSVQ